MDALHNASFKCVSAIKNVAAYANIAWDGGGITYTTPHFDRNFVQPAYSAFTVT